MRIIKISKIFLIILIVSAWIFSGWIEIQPAKALDNGIEKIKIKFDASPLASKYKMQGASFQKTIKADKAEKTEIRIGNETANSFEPSFEFKKWDEIRFKLTPKMEIVAQNDKDFDLVGDKIKYKTPKEEVHFYELAKSVNLPEGGYEIERILNEKPATNALSFDMEIENLEFFYQPIYTDAEIANKAEGGDFINSKVMGSYTIFYKNAPINWVGGKKYGTGKVGDIYRPRIDDSAGNWTYGELNIDTAAKKLTVIIPQDFLDNAVYPIYHASGLVIGYETIGTAGTQTIENATACSLFTMGTDMGSIDTVDVYTTCSNVARTFNTGVYLHSNLSFVTNATSPTKTPAADASWKTTTYVTKPYLAGSTEYLLCVSGSNGTGNHTVSYNNGASNQGHTQTGITGLTYPNPLVPTHTTRIYSIHANYTPDVAPTASISQPPGGGATIAQNGSYTITYVLADTDDVVTAALYYDNDTSDYNGTAIGACSAVTEGGTTCVWNTNTVPAGNYYIYASTTDSVNAPVYSAYSGALTINALPTASISQPDGIGDSVVVGASYDITYSLSDTDDTVTAALYWDTDASGYDGTAISACSAVTEAGTICAWDTAGRSAGNYYIYASTTDGVNAPVFSAYSGALTISAAVISVTITSDGFVEYGYVPLSGSKSTIELPDTQNATNSGNVTEKFNIKTSNATSSSSTWTLGSATATQNVYIHSFATSSGWVKFAATDSYQTLVEGVAPNGSQNFDLRIGIPSSVSDYQQKTIYITIQAVQQ